MERVAEAVAALRLAGARLERLKTAVAEATMNAMEHGNRYRADAAGDDPGARSTAIGCACASPTRAAARDIPDAVTPDLEAKLAGLQTPRGWGLFLIKAWWTRCASRATATATRWSSASTWRGTHERRLRPEAVVHDRDGMARDRAERRDRRRRGAAIARAGAEAAALGRPGVLLDFAGADYINSTGIALIVGLLARARAERREVSARGLTPTTTGRSSRSPGCRTS